MTDSIFDNDPGWQSLSKALRNRSRDWLRLRSKNEPFDPYRNWHSLNCDEQRLQQQLWRWDLYSMVEDKSHRTALEQYYQAEARRYQPSSGFAYNGPFGGLFGSAF
jgi:hypothetical protein